MTARREDPQARIRGAQQLRIYHAILENPGLTASGCAQQIALAKFRVYPTRKSLFFHVFIWRTLRDFRKANPGNSHALGLCRGEMVLRFRKGKPVRLTPKLGEIHLSRKHLFLGIITHECAHAALRWAERIGLKMPLNAIVEGHHEAKRQTCPEERFCHALGNMARQIAWHANKRKILT